MGSVGGHGGGGKSSQSVGTCTDMTARCKHTVRGPAVAHTHFLRLHHNKANNARFAAPATCRMLLPSPSAYILPTHRQAPAAE